VTTPRHAAARPRDNGRGPRSGAAAVYARLNPEGRASGGGRLAGRCQPARPDRTRRRRPSAARLPSRRRPPALAGATRPAAGGRSTACGAGRPDRKWQANDRRRAPAMPGMSLRREGLEAECVSSPPGGFTGKWEVKDRGTRGDRIPSAGSRGGAPALGHG